MRETNFMTAILFYIHTHTHTHTHTPTSSCQILILLDDLLSFIYYRCNCYSR